MKRILTGLLWLLIPIVSGAELQSVRLSEHAEYPEKSEIKKIAGKVRAQFDVDNRGLITNIHILNAEPAGLFYNMVLDTMKKWKFTKGKPSKHNIITLTFRPNLANREVPEPNQPGHIQSRGVPFK